MPLGEDACAVLVDDVLERNGRHGALGRVLTDARALAGELPDMSGYDTVFIGFPIWWYVEPRIVDTFLAAADLANKTLIPFATSGGSGIGGAEGRMHGLRPGSVWKPGKLLNGVDAASWAQSAL